MKAGNFSIELPEPIAAYWTAANAGQSESAAACFRDEAVVHDEGHRYEGVAAIAAWIEQTTRQYQPVVEPLQCTEEAGTQRVVAKASGSFPGSPVELVFDFTLKNQKILRLEIR